MTPFVNLKSKIKSQLKRSAAIVSFVHRWRSLKRRLGIMKYPKIRGGEIEFFNHIQDSIGVLVDVGVRFDTDYIKLSTGKGKRYYLFEASPRYYKKLLKNLAGFPDDIFAYSLAVGEKRWVR